MPRVASDAKGFANRMIEKVVALRSELEKYTKVRADLSLIPADSPTYSMMTDYLRKIETDRDSLVISILGMHEKLITGDYFSFISFASDLALRVSPDADTAHFSMLKLAGIIVEPTDESK